ncbi:MAG: trypsin-like serine protease [Bradymonadia bacterium]
MLRYVTGTTSVVILAGIFTGCGESTQSTALGEVVEIPATPEGFTESLDDKIRRGQLTEERPEVGTLSTGCTATLVAPDVAITAAHCVGYRSTSRPGNYGSFRVRPAGQDRQSFTVTEYKSFSRQLGSGDIALLKLGSVVPETLATPRPLAPETPTEGTALSVWGYGCTERGYSTDWQKRKADFTQGEATNHLCPGDSGGPVFDETTGAILRINSGYYRDRFGTDIFGHVPTYYAEVRAQVVAWSSGDIPEINSGPQEDRPEDDPPLGDLSDQEERPEDDRPEGDQPEQDQPEQDQPEQDQPEQDQPEGDQPEQDQPENDQPEQEDKPRAEDPQQEVCGTDRQVFAQWTCTVSGRYKHLCTEGQAPQWVACQAGCRVMARGEDDICAEDGEAEVWGRCPQNWQPYTQWTCTREPRIMGRCKDGDLQLHRCANGCTQKQGPDHCTE